MGEPEDDKLLNVAGAISDGGRVNWDRIREQAGDAATSNVLRELHALEQIAAFHRGAEPAETPTAERSERRDAPPLGTWGHFTLLETIGEGSFGTVYRARDTKLQACVALKLIPLPEDRSVNLSRALKEARLLARVRHINVVSVYGADVIDGRVGIWMELIDGRTLTTLLREQGAYGAREAAMMGGDLCQALAAVHAAGLVHGDVKARNVIRAAGGRTVLMDFGTGKDLRIQPVRAGGHDVAGTPLYLAPEVFRGAPRSTRTDIYGLGVLLYHLVTAAAYPVDGRTQQEVEDAHRRGTRTRLRDARPDLPADFVAVVERAIDADPAARFQTIGAFEAALAQFLGRPPAPLPAPSPSNILIASAAIVALAGLGAAKYWVDIRSQKTNPPATVSAEAAPPGATSAAASTYRIDTALYRQRGDAETRLHSGDRVAPGDQLFAKLSVSLPAYVYIVNEDDHGETFLLFPLPGQAVENPVAPGTSVRIPGMRDAELSWQITSAGGREHFFIFASLERLQAFEEIFAALPRPVLGRRVESAKLPPQTTSRLRSAGGLAAAPASSSSARLATVFTTPLGDEEETAHGLWVRQLTVENPGRR